jgi:hypothetical protein
MRDEFGSRLWPIATSEMEELGITIVQIFISNFPGMEMGQNGFKG